MSPTVTKNDSDNHIVTTWTNLVKHKKKIQKKVFKYELENMK